MTAVGADFLSLEAAELPTLGRTAWLSDRLRTAVLSGRLVEGTVLPPSRALATDLGLSRGVIVEAYQRLVDEGLLTARQGAGTTVSALPSAAGRARKLPAPQAFRLPLPVPAGIGTDLSPGVPDLSAFPRAAWLKAERAVLGAATPADLGYGDPRGHPALRTAVAGWLARTRGIRADPTDLIVVSGVAQALALVSQVLHSRGRDRVAVEDPGSRGARDTLAHWGLQTVPVPVDGDGLVVADLLTAQADAVMVTPAHQFPTGVVLAPARRRALLSWASRGGLVVEDDYDAEHRYDRAPVPALHASAPEQVAHTGSMSKTLAPGLRLGWLIGPTELRADLIDAKHASDIASPALPQLVLARLIGSGALERHLRIVRARQRLRRDAVLAALAQHLPGARVDGVAAGLHLLVMLPRTSCDVDLLEPLQAAGVWAHPLSWHRVRPGPPGLVIGYAAHPPDRLYDAVTRLARVVRTSR